MKATLFASNGAPVVLGLELGGGGEGTIYNVHGSPNQVAKIYHKAPDPRKQSKLQFMASTADAELLKYVAWPQETLHSMPSGPVIGFLMPKVEGRQPIHMVYSPAHRRQDHPNVAWDFLLFVARNVAASFEALHLRGHIVGDVNQDSFMVGKDSKVILIDSDSFQVNARGALHLCEVGVSHFTSPELQSLASFNGITRSTNHDNFGLALLVFHLLFGGRHPFSGVPFQSGVGDALETDIKHFRYAYALDNQARGIGPPPRSIPLSLVTDSVASMFSLAFTEVGANQTRPTAQAWVAALDGLRIRLKSCGSSRVHIYPDHLSKCPWCELEVKGVTYFITIGSSFTPTPSGFALTQIWGIIEMVSPPPSPIIPTSKNFSLKPIPLPGNIPGEGTKAFCILFALAMGVAIIVAAPQAWCLGFVVGLIGWLISANVGSSERATEASKRRASLETAKREYDQLVDRAKKEAGPEGFLARKVDLAKFKSELEHLGQTQNQEIERLRSTAYDRQKQKYLETCFLDMANISGLGPARKDALRSFGIETAADVSINRVAQVRGFGPGLTQAVLDWKFSCERRFQFNPANAVTQYDRDTVAVRLAAKRAELERMLSAAPLELQAFNQRAVAQQAVLKLALESAAMNLAQAEANLTIIH